MTECLYLRKKKKSLSGSKVFQILTGLIKDHVSQHAQGLHIYRLYMTTTSTILHFHFNPHAGGKRFLIRLHFPGCFTLLSSALCSASKGFMRLFSFISFPYPPLPPPRLLPQ